MKKLTYIFFISLLIISCQKNNNSYSKIQSMLNSSFIMTKELEEEFMKLRKESEFIIISYIDSANCTNCKLNELAVYKLYEEKLKQKFATDIFFIINHSDEEEVNMLMKSVSMDFPYIVDRQGSIKRMNQISDEAIYQTFILNRENQIIWIGSPVYNEKSWELYEDFMKEVQSK